MRGHLPAREWSDVGRGNHRGSRGDHGRGNGRDRGGNSDRDRDSDRDSGRQRGQNRDQEERKVSFRDDVDTPNRRRNGRPRSLPGGIPIEAADDGASSDAPMLLGPKSASH